MTMELVNSKRLERDDAERDKLAAENVLLREALGAAYALIESTLAHVSHGGPTRAEAQAVYEKMKSVLKK